jgi:hypothetical protein
LAGLNCTLSVTAELGFKVTGNAAPEIVKPTPATEAALMVSGVVPVDVRVTDCVNGALSKTLPKATVFALMLSVPVPAGINCSAKFVETPLAVAVKVAVCTELTDDTIAVNPV